MLGMYYPGMYTPLPPGVHHPSYPPSHRSTPHGERETRNRR